MLPAREYSMSEVYEIIRRAGRIPLDELVLRSSQPAPTVVQELRLLVKEGWVEIKGDIPPVEDIPARASSTIVMLTSRGISANTA